MKYYNVTNEKWIECNVADGIKGTYQGNDMILLNEGTWLRSLRDGRFVDNQENYWSEIYETSYMTSILEASNYDTYDSPINVYIKN
jgi:hypothetical protein